ncbi:MAG: PstS family phosphate ABC transporter substrate-binding protein [Planctomycetota bacterium]|nr:PstS family phosphate ABC transporter substrate-binding protein [Planctomycetota bacterium]
MTRVLGWAAVVAAACVGWMSGCGESPQGGEKAPAGATAPATGEAPKGAPGSDAPTGEATSNVVKTDGSSTVFLISQAVAEEFQIANKGLRATVGNSGTGGGFKKFARGEIDVANASRPISKTEIEDCAKAGVEFIELPVAYDALTVVVNKENTWARSMTVAELKKVWEPEAKGVITRWNQVRPEWPDAPIDLFGPGADSGTFDYFTEAIVGKAKASRPDYTPSEDDNTLVTGVERSKNALGYFGMAYYLAHQERLTPVAIAWDKNTATKDPVTPSPATVLNGTYAPLSRPLFIYVNKKSADTRAEVRQFVEFYLANAGKLATEVRYVPLPDAAYQLAASRFAQRKAGSVFAGESPVGIKIEDVLAREAE